MSKYSPIIMEMKQSIIDCLGKLEKGYGHRKWRMSRETGIPEDVLTVLLKQLRHEEKVQLIMIWSEDTGQPNGSGYCLKGNLREEFNS